MKRALKKLSNKMKIKCVLAKTTTDQIKSKIRSNELFELVLDCYLTPLQAGQLVNDLFDREFEVEIKEKDGK